MCSDGQPPAPSHCLRLGIVTDVQYADIDNKGSPFTRDYRGTLKVLEEAVAFFNAWPSPLDFVAHLGDIVDDYNSTVDDGATTQAALSEVMSRFARLEGARDRRVRFLLGNHEMYNWSREALCRGVETPHGIFRCADESGRSYYSFRPEAGWRVLVLDPFVESIYSRGRGGGLDEDALQRVCELNPNIRAHMEESGDEARRLGTVQCRYFDGLEGVARRFCAFNGALGEEQRAWLRRELSEATASGERAVLLCHLVFHPEATRAPAGDEDMVFGKTLLWDFEDVLGLLHEPCGRCVAACFHGHQHEGGFHTDELGIHHVVFEAPLFGPTYAVAELSAEFLTLHGRCNARLPSLVFPDTAPGGESRRVLQLRRGPRTAAAPL